MLTHQDNRPYEVAVQEVHNKLNSTIERGRVKAQTALQDIITEHQVRQDMLVPGHAMNFSRRENKILVIETGNRQIDLTSHAQSQLLGRLGLPKTYVNNLMDIKDPWAADLLHHNLKELAQKGIGNDRLLLRVVGGTAKGVLSSSYRRLDAAPVFQAFIEEGLKSGFVPVDGINTMTRYHLKMIKDVIYEPVKDEILVYGLGLTTSDYGVGAIELEFLLMRVWCTNYAMGGSILRQIHLGKRFNDESENLFSQDTYDLDTKTVASAIKDMFHENMDERIDKINNAIAVAATKQIDTVKAIEDLRKEGTLNKEQALAAKTLYDNVQEITMLPQGDSAWRLSNVLSLMAQKEGLDDQKLELEHAAMELVGA